MGSFGFLDSFKLFYPQSYTELYLETTKSNLLLCVLCNIIINACDHGRLTLTSGFIGQAMQTFLILNVRLPTDNEYLFNILNILSNIDKAKTMY